MGGEATKVSEIAQTERDFFGNERGRVCGCWDGQNDVGRAGKHTAYFVEQGLIGKFFGYGLGCRAGEVVELFGDFLGAGCVDGEVGVCGFFLCVGGRYAGERENACAEGGTGLSDGAGDIHVVKTFCCVDKDDVNISQFWRFVFKSVSLTPIIFLTCGFGGLFRG